MNILRRVCALAGTTAVLSGLAVTAEVPLSTPEPARPSPSRISNMSRGERIAAQLHLRGWSPEMCVAAIAALPVVELRGAIPVGVWYFQLPWWRALLWAYLGNLLPVPLILLLLEPISRFARRRRWGDRFMEWLLRRARRRVADVARYEKIGLALFVAIPLPATGAWTGAMVAVMLSMPWFEAFVWISVGVLVAGFIVTVLTLLGWVGAGIAAAVLLAMAIRAARSYNSPRANPAQ